LFRYRFYGRNLVGNGRIGVSVANYNFTGFQRRPDDFGQQLAREALKSISSVIGEILCCAPISKDGQLFAEHGTAGSWINTAGMPPVEPAVQRPRLQALAAPFSTFKC